MARWVVLVLSLLVAAPAMAADDVVECTDKVAVRVQTCVNKCLDQARGCFRPLDAAVESLVGAMETCILACTPDDAACAAKCQTDHGQAKRDLAGRQRQCIAQERACLAKCTPAACR